MNLFENNIISILISLTLIYALLSIFVSILTEWWNYIMRERGKMLKDAIIKLLSDPENHEYGYLFYGHFMISGLQSDSRPPQYISSTMFSEVLIDVIARQAEHSQRISQNLNTGGDSKTYIAIGAAPPDTVIEKFKVGLDMMNESYCKDMLLSFWNKSEGKYEDLKKLIAHWYDDYMDRVTGWYKSKQRRKLLVVGFIVAIGLNVDSWHLVKILSLDDNLRNTLVNTAESVADNYTKNAKKFSDSTSSNSKFISIFEESKKAAAKDTSSKDSSTVANYKALDASISKLREKVSFFDSASVAYLNRADSVIDLAASLGIPLGWSWNTAPLSWLKRKACVEKNSCKNEKCMNGHSCECRKHCTEHEVCKKEKCCEKRECCSGKETDELAEHTEQACEARYREGSGLWRYISARNNCSSCMAWMKYVLGIIITGVSLSFGAPFWFEMLVKLVNIRRAGKKPGSLTDKK
jgi:hypothetical protein